MFQLVKLVCLVLKEKGVMQMEHPELREQVEHPAHPAHRVLLGQLERRVARELRAQVVVVELEVLVEHPELMEHQELQEQMELRERVVLVELLELREQAVLPQLAEHLQ
jgi:hypothetical protein